METSENYNIFIKLGTDCLLCTQFGYGRQCVIIRETKSVYVQQVRCFIHALDAFCVHIISHGIEKAHAKHNSE